MALALGVLVPTSFYSPTRLTSQISASRVAFHGRVLRTFRCLAVSLPMQNCKQSIVRRSANYKPPIWDYDYVQSLNSKYAGDVYAKRAAKLVEDVKIMLDKVADPVVGLEMIDELQRLGVFYHFEKDIKRVLENISNNNCNDRNKEDLRATALKFRLMRQHGYTIPQGVFDGFKDESGSFKACLCEDINGMLYLYEASYFCVEGESTLEEVRDFATKHLRQSLKRKDIHHDLAMLVSHALELPLHWRVTRLEARWFIDVYERRPDMNPTLLQLAKLDYNIVQATHQADLKHMSRRVKAQRHDMIIQSRRRDPSARASQDKRAKGQEPRQLAWDSISQATLASVDHQICPKVPIKHSVGQPLIGSAPVPYIYPIGTERFSGELTQAVKHFGIGRWVFSHRCRGVIISTSNHFNASASIEGIRASDAETLSAF